MLFRDHEQSISQKETEKVKRHLTYLFLRTVYHEIESWTTENNSVELKKQIISDNIDSRIYSVTLVLSEDSEDRIIIFEMQSK